MKTVFIVIVSKNTALVLVSALYFKAAWKHPLQITNVERFFVTKQNSVPFIVMSVTQNFTYKHDEDLGAKILEIPYEVSREYVLFFVNINDLLIQQTEIQTCKLNCMHMDCVFITMPQRMGKMKLVYRHTELLCQTRW